FPFPTNQALGDLWLGINAGCCKLKRLALCFYRFDFFRCRNFLHLFNPVGWRFFDLLRFCIILRLILDHLFWQFGRGLRHRFLR
ncbi:MAG TPA: hypothetical protein DIW28_06945, partial [Zetaproteobacteria bacterium]|nr:hypothetical protein [Zetaproteobacteria bacterium]